MHNSEVPLSPLRKSKLCFFWKPIFKKAFLLLLFFLTVPNLVLWAPNVRAHFLKPFLRGPSVFPGMCLAFPEAVFKPLLYVFLSPVFIIMHKASSEIIFTHIAQILRFLSGPRFAVVLGGGMCLPVFGDLRHFSCLLRKNPKDLLHKTVWNGWWQLHLPATANFTQPVKMSMQMPSVHTFFF